MRSRSSSLLACVALDKESTPFARRLVAFTLVEGSLMVTSFVVLLRPKNCSTGKRLPPCQLAQQCSLAATSCQDLY